MTVYQQTVNVGSSFEQTYLYLYAKVPVNLAGWGAVFRLRNEDGAVISTVRYGDTGDRSLLISAPDGQIDVTMVASATAGITARSGTFELELYELINPGRVVRIVDGSVAYRPRGRGVLDNRVCVIQSSSNQVVVETQRISSYVRIDRGPPGAQGSAALDNQLPTIAEDPAIGGSTLAPKADRQYGLATQSRHGFMRLEDKTSLDRVGSSTAFSPAPGTDDTGSGDLTTLNALITAAVGSGTDVQLQPGKYLINDEWSIQQVTQKLVIRGAGCGKLDLTKGTIIEYVGGRIAGKSLVNAIGSNVSFENIHFVVNLAENAIHQPIGMHQPTGCVVQNCILSSRDVIVATSTTNLTAALADFTLAGVVATSTYPISTHVGSSTRSTDFPDDSKVLLVSRSSPRTQMWCKVKTAGFNPGAQTLAITALEIYDTAAPVAHNDWDIRQPGSVAVDYTGAACCKVKSTSFEGFYTSWAGYGSFSCVVDDDCITGRPWGPQFTADGSAYVPRIEATVEPNNTTNRKWGVKFGTTFHAIVRITTGDPELYGSPVELNGGKYTVVEGVLISSGTTDALIKATATEGLHVRAELQTPAGGKGVDFTGGGINQRATIDCPDFPVADLILGTANVHYTGMSLADDGILRATGSIRASFFTAVNTLVRNYDAGAPIALGSGSVTTLSVVNALSLLTTTGGATVHGASITLNGQEQVLFYAGTHTVTFAHLSGTQPDALLKFVCPGAVDLVMQPPPSGGFWMIRLIPINTLGVLMVPEIVSAGSTGGPVQRGVVTLSSGVTATISAHITSASRIVVSQKSPSGTANTVEYSALTGDRSTGSPGTFKITALIAAGTINTADNSTVDWVVSN